MVDAESIESRLSRLEQLIAELERIGGDGHAAYESDLRTRLAAQHAIQIAVQTCIDIGAHLIADFGLEMATEYRGVFGQLERVGLEPELARKLSDAAGMRNILVHGYMDVDDAEIWSALDDLDALRQFASFAADLTER